jgi:hypothetical protein
MGMIRPQWIVGAAVAIYLGLCLWAHRQPNIVVLSAFIIIFGVMNRRPSSHRNRGLLGGQD